MRLTSILCRQHVGRMFKKHWHIKGKRTPIDTGADYFLAAKGIKVVDVVEYLHPMSKKIETEPLPENWHETPCYLFKDENMLLEGVPQAQVLLNTIKFDGYPEKLEDFIHKSVVPPSMDKNLQQSVLNACVFDAEQVKLGYKKKDIERPAFNFPRIYGITDARKNRLLYQKLIQNCEKLATQHVQDRRFLNDAIFKIPFSKDLDLIKLELVAETFITSRNPISSVNETKRTRDLVLPNIFPIKCTVSIPQSNVYTKETVYPVRHLTNFGHPHTILLHFKPLETKNLFDAPVIDTQIEARAMLKAFAVAATKAKLSQSDDVKDLSHPIVVQTVQSDGKRYQFGLFQLNTLNLDEKHGIKNYWYCGNMINLYDECSYQVGKPILEGYNKDVIKHMLAFYNNS